jgi:hypothetical protein
VGVGDGLGAVTPSDGSPPVEFVGVLAESPPHPASTPRANNAGATDLKFRTFRPPELNILKDLS